MQTSPAIFSSHYRPTKCERRVYLRAHGEPESEPSEFDKLLRELGARHEADHISSFPGYLDLRVGSFEERIEKTRDAIHSGTPIIYQGILRSTLPGSSDSVVGIPDILIRDGEGYRIRDCKLARHADDRHPEIPLQLQLYGWLFGTSIGKQPTKLEVYLGDKSIVEIPVGESDEVLNRLRSLQQIGKASKEPYSPVGWSKCGPCGYKKHCWSTAEKEQDVALVYELDQGTAIALREQGVCSIQDLTSRFTADTLAELKRPKGEKMVRVGVAASRIMLQAKALQTNTESLIDKLVLPSSENLVMFDLEGVPPQFDELDKVYLWGTQVFGTNAGAFRAALAGFGEDGDKAGWVNFLMNAGEIFKSYGDIPFIHWATYETTKLKAYKARYGDIDAIAERVLKNCVDLLSLTRKSLVLPEYSYSLKVIEKRVGFKRTMDEFGGSWSIVQYIRAVETKDEQLREEIMSQILKYNEEDLLATWAVYQWLKSKA